MLNRLKILSTSKLTSSTAFGFLSLRDFTIEYIAFKECLVVFNQTIFKQRFLRFRPLIILGNIRNCNNLLHFFFWNRVTFICIIQLKSPWKYKRQIMINLTETNWCFFSFTHNLVFLRGYLGRLSKWFSKILQML